MRRRDFLSAGLLPLSLPVSGQGQSRCIVLKLTGGASHLDTWDMKPDAPAEIRGPFRPIRTNVAGMYISEIFPRMARHADKYAIIRSVHHEAKDHAGAEALFDLRHERVHTASAFGDQAWDIHGWKPFRPIVAYRDVAGPAFDAAYTALLEGLEARGLLESTLVVALGEFGRTPKINPDGGRDHWPHCFSVLMAGGGIRGGQIYGSSDRIGAEPRDHPVTPEMITATIRRVVGIEAPVEGARSLDALFA